jgi:putative Holliday junction resolvase|tara:strand:+ start:5319 stop:5828 length:510 start_codon:yes stop_codon:yes gene_type:complete
MLSKRYLLMPAGNMIFMNLNELVAHIKKNTRLLGIDLGSKTIGIAVSDPFLKIASPITTLIRLKLSKNSIELDKIVNEYQVGGLIVGLPINMDGTEGPRAQATRDWTLDVIKALQLPAAFWDERLSTIAVERMMLKADMTRKRRAAKIDQAAAAYILQGALDNITMQTS